MFEAKSVCDFCVFRILFHLNFHCALHCGRVLCSLILFLFLASCGSPNKNKQVAQDPQARAESNDQMKDNPEDNSDDSNPSHLSLEEEVRLRKAARQKNCVPVSESAQFTLASPRAKGDALGFNVSQMLQGVYSACSNCHAPRIALGGFRFVESIESQTVSLNGIDTEIQGIAQAAEKIQDVLARGVMPPDAGTRADYFFLLGDQMQQWIAAGKPRPQNFSDSSRGGDQGALLPEIWGLSEQSAFSSLGDCIPTTGVLGADSASLLEKSEHSDKLEHTLDADSVRKIMAERNARVHALDAVFTGIENSDALPKKLSQTDLFSLDAELLAQTGTFAYDVEYPLWNDYAKKLRHIHLPRASSDQVAGLAVSERIKLLEDSGLKSLEYDIPENTRFYKTFFAQRRNAKGLVIYKPIETRIIVVRKEREPLFGTYIWNDEFSEADLLQTPYRDGTPWKDLVLEDVFDATRPGADGNGLKRQYPVPAKHRCVQCHQGTTQKSFVLGFAPYQLNIQSLNHAGKVKDVPLEKLQQIDRLAEFGVLDAQAANYKPALRDLPRLDRVSSHRAETFDFVLDAQGYFIGNCAHCHNPNGYAYKEGQVKFDLRPGFATDFPTHLTPTKFSNDNLRLVSPSGNLDISYLYRKVAGEEAELRGQDRMPLSTPGAPHCEASWAVARWVLSYNTSLSRQDILDFQLNKPCAAETDFARADTPWIEEDLTVNEKEYVPKRADWKDPELGMPSAFRELQFAEGLIQLGQQEFPTGWWLNVDDKCRFPDVEDADAKLREFDAMGLSWIRAGVESGRAPKTLGQLYTSTPGAHFFGQTCVKCHGRLGRGDGVIAKDFKQIQPANFVSGMFGQDGANQKHFDDLNSAGEPINLVAQYFVWMAVEGTRLKEVPPAAVDLVGKYGGRMLGQIRDNCFRLLSGEKNLARDYLLYKEVCEFENLKIEDPLLALNEDSMPVNSEQVERWLDKGAVNAGFLIFEYVQKHLARGKFKPSQGECDMVPDFQTENVMMKELPSEQGENTRFARSFSAIFFAE